MGWRPMRRSDLPVVVRIAAASFPDHFEGLDCFAERLALCPQFCFALDLDDEVQGYLIAYPWPLGEVPPLNSLLGALPADRTNIYLHDLALAPQARGGGHTRPVVEILADAARAAGAATLSLVSVNESQAFWRGLGFAAEEGPASYAKLASYGLGARHMVRRL